MDDRGQNFQETLQRYGFEKITVGSQNIWKLTSDDSSKIVKAKVEILQRKERYSLGKCSITLDCEKALRQIESLAKRRFPQAVNISGQTTVSNAIQVIVELSPNRNRTDNGQRSGDGDPGSVLGWTTIVSPANEALTLQVTDAFCLGTPVTDWWGTIFGIIKDAFLPGLDEFWTIHNMFEFSIPLWVAPLNPIKLSEEFHGHDLGRSASKDLKIPQPLRVKTDKHRIILDLSTPDEMPDDDVCIEILEARETAPLWKEVDLCIVRKQKATPTLPIRESGLRPTFARIAALPELAGNIRNTEKIEVTDLQNHSITSISGAAIILEREGRSHDHIKITSMLLRGIAETYGDLNQHAPLRHVIPELLGDLWSKVDPKLAFRSWQTAIVSRGNNPRILRKIARLAQETADFNLEFNTLIELCRTERRLDTLKSATLRLIEISEKEIRLDVKQTQELRSLLEVTAMKTNYQHTIVGALSRFQIHANEHRKALAILELCLKSEANEASASDIAKMHASIADIWDQQENNVSLAAARYTAATTYPADPSPEILDRAEAFFQRVGNAEQLKRLLLLRTHRPAERSSWEAIERAAKQMNKIGQHVDAINAIINLMKANRYQHWYCDIIMDGLDSEGVDWTQLTLHMGAVDAKQLPSDALPSWKLIAARCAMKTGKDHDIALKILCERDVIPLLGLKEANFVRSSFLTRNDHANLSKFIETRLSYAEPDETKDLLDVIVNHNLRSMDGTFDQTIAHDCNTTGDASRILRRLNKLFQAGDVPGLEAAITAIESVIDDSRQIIKILDSTIDRIIESTSPNLEHLLNKVILSRRNYFEFSEAEFSNIVKSMIIRKFLSTAAQLLESTIAAGQTGVDDADLIHDMFIEKPVIVCRWHFLMYEKSESDAVRHHHAKQHIHFALMSPIKPEEMVKTSLTVSQKDILHTSILQTLENVCKSAKQLNEFLGILVNQIEVNADESGDLVHWAIRLINQNNLDRELAASLFRTWSQKAGARTVHGILSEANLWLAAKNLPEAQRAFIAMLSEPEVLDVPDVCLKGIDGLVASKPAKTQLASVIQTLISWSESTPKSEITSQLIEKSIEHEVASSHHLHMMMMHHFESSTSDRLGNIAIQALAKAERTGNGVSKLLTEWQESMGQSSGHLKWKQLIECLTSDHLLRQLRRPARCEVLFLHAQNLIDDEQRRFDAIPHLEVIATENPMDSRVWIPLYSLYEESDAKRKLVSHLEKVIPLIERDKSLLEKTPFNLESLRNTLKRTKKLLLEREPNTASNSLGDNTDRPRNFDLNDHAARLQRAWIEAMPAVKISAISGGEPTDAPPTDEGAGGKIDSNSETNQTSEQHSFYGSAATNLEIQKEENDREFNTQFIKSETRNAPDLRIVDSQTNNSVHQIINWRDVVTNSNSHPNATRGVMTMAFASELEKHIAVQCIAIVGGETDTLKSWHWPVWRDRHAFQYPMTTSGRLPKDIGLIDHGGQLHKLLRMITPILARSHRGKFIAKTYFAQRGLPQSTESRQVELSHPPLARCALGIIESQLAQSKVRLFDTPGLGKDVFFDLSQRAIHFDGNWQLNLPPSILTYRIIETFLHFQKGSLPIITLNAETAIVPAIEIIKEILSANGLSRIRLAFGFEHRDVQSQIKALNQDKLNSLLSWNKDKTADDIKRLQQEIRFKILAETLAMTLDLVGICEAINGENLCLDSRLSAGDYRFLDPLSAKLILLATKLNI